MKKIAIILLSILFSTTIMAQEVMMVENPETLYQGGKWGQNRTNFIHVFGSYGMVVGFPEGGAFDLKYGLSRDWKFGIRYKLKLASNYAMGADFTIANTRFRIAQYGTNVFPDTLMHDKEYISISSFGLDYFNRINVGKRGNKVGKYFDLGVFATVNYLARHNYWDKLSTPYNGSTKVKTTLYKPNYITDLNWGIKARLGNERFAVWSSYRMSNLINSKFNGTNSVELPRTMVGVEIGIY